MKDRENYFINSKIEKFVDKHLYFDKKFSYNGHFLNLLIEQVVNENLNLLFS